MNTLHRSIATLLMITLLPALSFANSAEEPADEGDAKEGKKKPKASYVTLEPAFVTNFTDDKIRYIRTDVSIKVVGEKTKDAIRDHTFAIRHHLVMLLNRQTEQDLRSVEGRTQLQQDAAAEVIAVLEEENNSSDVQEVLFTTFVIE